MAHPEATTLKHLYQLRTGDLTSHQRKIHARYLLLDSQRRAILDRRLAGDSVRAIARRYGVTGAAISASINAALEKIRKGIAGEPRYNRRGHPGAPRKHAA